MAGMTSVLAALPTIVSGVNAVVSHRSEKKENALAQRQLEAQQRLQEQQAATDAVLQKEQMAQESKATEDERRAALKRAMARQRANFGSQGIGSGNGSSQAVLLGMFEESDAERERREQLDNLRLRIVDEDLSQRRTSNILQRTQLAEKNKLSEATASAALASKTVRLAGGLI